MNQMLNSKSELAPINCIQKENSFLYAPDMIATAFNDYFVQAGKTSSIFFNDQNQVTISSELPTQGIQDVSLNRVLYPTEENEILNIIKALKNKNNTSHCKISNRLLKLCANELVNPICHIVNTSLETGNVPDNLKVAKIVPVYKKGDPLSLDNYRPIAILPVISKILEKIVKIRLKIS